MKDDKDNKDDLIVDIDESQLALPIEDKDDLIVETKVDEKAEEVKAEAAEKKERKRHNQDAIDALQAQLKAREDELVRERQAKEATERRLRERESELGTAREHVAQSDYERVQGYIAAARAREDSLKRELRSASEIGDHGRIADLQVEIASVAARKMQYEDAKVDLERTATRAKEERTVEREPEPVQRHGEPTFEDRISALSHKSQAWLREHPDCVTDPKRNAKLMGAHYEALSNEIRPDSREYFAFLEDKMGYSDETDDEGDVEIETQRAESRRGVPAAPVSRDARPGSQLAPGKYRLTREEVEMAEAMGISPAKYAENKIKMHKQGLWTN
jgi:chromosome segregation ATPase